jgi:hypothetical protein
MFGTPVHVTITPDDIQLDLGEELAFGATLAGAADPSVIWSRLAAPSARRVCTERINRVTYPELASTKSVRRFLAISRLYPYSSARR